MMQARAVVFIPKDHGIVDCMTASIFLLDKLDDFANTAIADNLCNLLEVRMVLADAMIREMLGLNDSVTDDESFCVALVNAHSRFSGKPLGGTNSPP